MKKVLTATGYFSLSFLILGSLFKIQHYPGASLMLLIGSLVFVIGFLPQYLIYRYKNKTSDFEGMEAIAFTVSMALSSFGLLFKVQHYPGGSVLLIAGFLSFMALFIPLYVYRFFVEKRKRQSEYILIGMIAIAVTFMLFSHNISKETLLSYTLNEAKTNINNLAIQKSNNAIYHVVEKSNNAVKLEKAKEIQQFSSNIYNFLESYKSHIIQEADGISDSELEEYFGGKISLKESHNKDAVDVISRMLIFDPGNPKTGQWSAVEIKQQLVFYKEHLLAISESEYSKNNIEVLLNFEPVPVFGYEESWEIGYFYHMPLVSVINTLTNLQNSTLAAESLALSELVEK